MPDRFFRRARRVAGRLTIVAVCLFPGRAAAQETAPADHDHSTMNPSAAGWTWATDANTFTGFNYQNRRFADFAAWESQNWFMATGGRSAGPGRVIVHGMLSFEPFTLGRFVYTVGGAQFRAGGSPQVFQTGETFNGSPLIDYQHPHDLVMGLGATYRLPRPRLTYVLGADLVGSPSLGPTPFMHRESARNNPQVPLGHHQLDSTHVTAGVVRAGVELSAWTFETSLFRGEEADERRYGIDEPRLDSWAARIGWRQGPWRAQVSGGRLHEPEWYAPYDQTRLTASVAFSGAIATRPAEITAAWGQTREYTPDPAVAGAFLVEWDLRVSNTLATYGRAELVRKELFPHPHTPGMPHPHYFSDITAVTLGAVQDLSMLGLDRLGRVGLGADVTLYRISPDIQVLYGRPRSFHAFVRWRPRSVELEHVH